MLKIITFLPADHENQAISFINFNSDSTCSMGILKEMINMDG